MLRNRQLARTHKEQRDELLVLATASTPSAQSFRMVIKGALHRATETEGTAVLPHFLNKFQPVL